MSDSYILHDVMRKVKAEGLFDSIRRDLLSDIEQKPSYLNLKSSIESSMSSYLAEHNWSSALKKSELRERARRHIETSNLVKETLPTMVSQYMQTCQDKLVQPRLASFVTDHIGHVYHSIGGTHVYHPPASSSFVPPPSSRTDTVNIEPSPSTVTIKKEPVANKPKPSTSGSSQSPNLIKKKPAALIPSVKKNPSVPPPAKPMKQEEKRARRLSPSHSPTDISPSPPRVDKERRRVSSSPSPPPPVVRIASPLARRAERTAREATSKPETSRKSKRSHDTRNDSASTMIKKKKKKSEVPANDDDANRSIPGAVSQSTEDTDTRKLRPRRPHSKYSKEHFETGDLDLLEVFSPPRPSKAPKLHHTKSSSSFERSVDDPRLDTPSSPCATSPQMEPSLSMGNISPEYGASSPMDQPQEDRSRTPSPVTTDSKKASSPRRLRPRKAYERSSIPDPPADLPTRTSSKVRHRSDPDVQPSVNDDEDDDDAEVTVAKAPGDGNDAPNRSTSVPENLTGTSEESQPTRTPTSASASKSFIWKPKISK